MWTRSLFASAAVVFLQTACGSGSATPSAPSQSEATAFDPGPVPEGFTRYEAPVIKGLKPGDDVMYCQWVAAPSNRAQNVLTVTGLQGTAGHHATLYANSVVESVGTSRICKDEDMVSITFLGAVGGEGTGGPAATLPDGMVFQMPQDQALMINAHYINATDHIVDGHTVLDVKFADPDPSLIVAGAFAINYLGIQIPPGPSYSVDVSCTVDQKFSFVMYTNHMHRYGTQAFSEVVRQDGTKETLSKDDTWIPEQAFNPPYVRWTKESPMVLNPGDAIHQRCTWKNDTADTIAFPTEMCVGAAYSMEAGPQYICNATAM